MVLRKEQIIDKAWVDRFRELVYKKDHSTSGFKKADTFAFIYYEDEDEADRGIGDKNHSLHSCAFNQEDIDWDLKYFYNKGIHAFACDYPLDYKESFLIRHLLAYRKEVEALPDLRTKNDK